MDVGFMSTHNRCLGVETLKIHIYFVDGEKKLFHLYLGILSFINGTNYFFLHVLDIFCALTLLNYPFKIELP